MDCLATFSDFGGRGGTGGAPDCCGADVGLWAWCRLATTGGSRANISCKKMKKPRRLDLYKKNNVNLNWVVSGIIKSKNVSVSLTSLLQFARYG